MLEQRDIDGLWEQMDDFFDSLPLLPQFSFIWKKATVTPGGSTYDTVFEAIPGFSVPSFSDNINKTPLGELVVEENKILAIPKRWGETCEVEGTLYPGGIQINDQIASQEGAVYKVINKQARGLGGYYILQLALEQGYGNTWLTGQFPT